MRFGFIGVALAIALTACNTDTAPVTNAAGSTAPASAPSQAAPLSTVSSSAAEAARLINAQRTSSGRNALVQDPRLIAAAQQHAQDMVNRGYFSHTGANGSTPKTRIAAQGFNGCYFAENIAQGQTSPSSAVTSWINSAPHRRNIMSGSARAIGVGVANRTWVAVFAAPC